MKRYPAASEALKIQVPKIMFFKYLPNLQVSKVKGLFKSPASPFNRPNPFKTSQTYSGSLAAAADEPTSVAAMPVTESADDILKKLVGRC